MVKPVLLSPNSIDILLASSSESILFPLYSFATPGINLSWWGPSHSIFCVFFIIFFFLDVGDLGVGDLGVGDLAFGDDESDLGDGWESNEEHERITGKILNPQKKLEALKMGANILIFALSQ